jgi:hypothetical protein
VNKIGKNGWLGRRRTMVAISKTSSSWMKQPFKWRPTGDFAVERSLRNQDINHAPNIHLKYMFGLALAMQGGRASAFLKAK